MNTITGDKALDRKLKHLADKTAKRAIVRGIRASLTSVAKACRAAVNAADASPELKREARRAIGSRFVRGGTNRMGQTTASVAKVGFAVGKRAAAVKGAKAARAKRITGGKSSGQGVGISAANIHWPVLGTDEREQKYGKPTGRMEGVFGEVTAVAFGASQSAALAAARAKIAAEIEKDARKQA